MATIKLILDRGSFEVFDLKTTDLLEDTYGCHAPQQSAFK
jgi:hypothetical protein